MLPIWNFQSLHSVLSFSTTDGYWLVNIGISTSEYILSMHILLSPALHNLLLLVHFYNLPPQFCFLCGSCFSFFISFRINAKFPWKSVTFLGNRIWHSLFFSDSTQAATSLICTRWRTYNINLFESFLYLHWGTVLHVLADWFRRRPNKAWPNGVSDLLAGLYEIWGEVC